MGRLGGLRLLGPCWRVVCWLSVLLGEEMGVEVQCASIMSSSLQAASSDVQWQLEHFEDANMRHVLLYQISTATYMYSTTTLQYDKSIGSARNFSMRERQ